MISNGVEAPLEMTMWFLFCQTLSTNSEAEEIIKDSYFIDTYKTSQSNHQLQENCKSLQPVLEFPVKQGVLD